jgi:hypothetical protein
MYTNTVIAGTTPESGARTAAAVIREAEATRAPYYWAAWQVVGR